jgi:hypothetical protein
VAIRVVDKQGQVAAHKVDEFVVVADAKEVAASRKDDSQSRLGRRADAGDLINMVD